MYTRISISRIFSILLMLALTFDALSATPALAAGVRYATPGGAGDCSNWASACDLQTALTGAVSGDDIWAMAGTYVPTTGTDRTATFQLVNGVALYGGFAGTETAREQRDYVLNVTILSGDLNGNDLNWDNVYHVVTGATGATLDGFTITAGNANGTSPNNLGGGMYNSSSSPTLTNVTFDSNSAYWYGGGMHNDNSSPAMANVTFSGNRAGDYGGGMYNINSSNPILANATFSGNRAEYSGGGMYNGNSSPTLANVIFDNNSTTGGEYGGGGCGGGMYNDSSSPALTNVTFNNNSTTGDTDGGYGGGMCNLSSSNPILTNVTFSGNSARRSGAGMYNYDSSPLVTNATFSGNMADSSGGGMYNGSSSPVLTNVTFTDNSAMEDGGGIYNDSSSPQIRNTILWRNPAGQSLPQVYNVSSTPSVSDSIVQGGCPAGSTCTAILTNDPRLGPLGSYGGSTQTVPLMPGSAAIDAGNDAACPAADQRGVTRPQGSQCDIGAYEDDGTIIDYILYAKPAAGGTGDCLSWANACVLQTALTTARSGNEIWVAAGTYVPTTGTDRTATFQLVNGVALYGGFAGTETAREQRDYVLNVTILSGDLSGDNAYHVVTGADNAILDGFTITAGEAGGTSPNNRGGGMYNSSSSPTLANVTFSGNWAASAGGGMYNSSASPSLTNVTFRANSSTSGGGMYNSSASPTLTTVVFNDNSATGGYDSGGYGGGMYNLDSNPTLTNVTFSDNSASGGTNFYSSNRGGYGGGMYNNSSSPILTDVTFSGNAASGGDDGYGGYYYDAYGGGMYNTSSNPLLTNVTFSSNLSSEDGSGIYNISSSPVLTNVTFSSNLASEDGGGMYNSSSSPWLTNVTFNDNAAAYGGGMYNSSSASSPLLDNTILWGNLASQSGPQVYNVSSTPSVSDSVVQGGCPYNTTCTNIITDDPKLGPLDSYGGSTQTIPLMPGSAAIDAGNDAVCPAADQRGVARPQGAQCDIGAYEDDGTVIDYLLYAKPTASGTGDCSSWANACTLQTALTTAVSGNEIWAAAGIYQPTTDPSDRNATFQLKNGVALYGGFAGTETERSQRDSAAHLTILSGDIDHNDSQTPIITDPTSVSGNTSNSCHVVTGASGASGNALDGFTITAGYADCASPHNRGGGMYNDKSSPVLTNLTFSGNVTVGGGGGMYNGKYSSPTLTNVTFSGNAAIGNANGGGMYNYDNSRPVLTNVTFRDNSANSSGGGMYSYDNSSPQIRNAIFWGNISSIISYAQIYNLTSTPTMDDSVVQGGCPNNTTCTNIITDDPKLGPLGSYGGASYTIPLLPGSAAIDAGNDAVCPAADQRGVARPQGAQCDIGAYEADGTVIDYILYAKPTASGTGDCLSWENACTLQTALATAGSGNEIWAAAGIYKPTTGTNRTATFQLSNGVAVYGGFAGTETERSQRDLAANVTILSGDLAGNDVGFSYTSENVYHVVTGGGNAILDGFTITGGNANDVSTPNDRGGGMYIAESGFPALANITFTVNQAVLGGGLFNAAGSRPALANVIFSGNAAVTGGGLYNYSSTPTLSYVTIISNTASSGGGMYNRGNSPVLLEVSFSANSADLGGGMYNESSDPKLTNVDFSDNTAKTGDGKGGGMFNDDTSTPTLVSVTFSRNHATYGGGMYNLDSLPTLTNVTFYWNSAAYGGGMYNEGISNPMLTNVTFGRNGAAYGGGMYNSGISTSFYPRIRNTIFWGNLAYDAGAQIYNENSTSVPEVRNSIVEGGCPAGSACTSILSADPLLGTLGSYGGWTQTLPLLPGSAAIDRGNSSYCPPIDQRGAARSTPSCDIGAYESQGFILTISGGNHQKAGINSSFGEPLAVMVTAGYAAEPVDGGLIIFTAPPIGASAVISGSPATIYSGTVSVTATANGFFDVYTVTASTVGAAPVGFTLENINAQAPTDITLSNQTIPENQPAGTSVGFFAAIDPDTGDTFTYILAAGAGDSGNAAFSISGDELLSAASFDFEAVASYSIRVRAADPWGLGYEKAFTITVGDVDESAPAVVSITRAGSSPTSAASVDFTVTFSENVTEVDLSDFTLATSGISGAAVTAVSGADSVYTVTVTTGAGNGTLRLDVSDNDSILDGAGNPLGGTGAGNGDFTAGETYTINKLYFLFLPLTQR